MTLADTAAVAPGRRRSPQATRWVLGIFVFALAIRLIYLGAVLGLTSPILVRFDDGEYHLLAQSIAAGHGMSHDGHPSAAVSPGYPTFLAACYAVFGPYPVAPRLVQAVLGAATAALLVALAFELGLGLVAAALAGLVASVYPSAIFFTGRYFPMVLHTFLLTVTVFGLVRWGRRGGMGWALSALALAAAALVRADTLMLAPLLAIAVFLLRRPAREALTAAVAILVCVAGLHGAWVFRNLRVLGRPVLTTTQASRARWEGNNPWARGGFALEDQILARYQGIPDPADLSPSMREQLAGMRRIEAARVGMSEVWLDSCYADLMERWRTHYPREYRANLVRKIVTFASPWPGQGGEVLRRYRYVILLSSGLVMPLAALGFVVARRRGPGGWVLLAVLAQALASAIIIFGHARFRYAAETLFIPYAAFGATWAFERITHRPGRA